MDETLKQKIIVTMLSIHERVGETIMVEDWISTSGRNYDRHQTRYGKYIIKIDSFGVRTSGAIASIRGKSQQIEFRSDSIKSIRHDEDELIMEINMKDDVWRRIRICTLNPIENIV